MVHPSIFSLALVHTHLTFMLTANTTSNIILFTWDLVITFRLRLFTHIIYISLSQQRFRINKKVEKCNTTIALHPWRIYYKIVINFWRYIFCSIFESVVDDQVWEIVSHVFFLISSFDTQKCSLSLFELTFSQPFSPKYISSLYLWSDASFQSESPAA